MQQLEAAAHLLPALLVVVGVVPRGPAPLVLLLAVIRPVAQAGARGGREDGGLQLRMLVSLGLCSRKALEEAAR